MRNIGIDFGIAARFTQNNLKKTAGCDTRTSHPATAALRKVRHDNFAPCDSLMLHPATSRYRTLPLSPIAQCDSKRPLLVPEITRPAIGAKACPFRGSSINTPPNQCGFANSRRQRVCVYWVASAPVGLRYATSAA